MQKSIAAPHESPPPHLEVDEQAFHGPVGVVDHQVEVELLDEQQLILQDLLCNPLLARGTLLHQVGNKLGAGHVELVHFAGQVSASQPENGGQSWEMLC